ncbi:hypothetical protein JCM11641_004247 [Rhodosporidiobolus odoratus]
MYCQASSTTYSYSVWAISSFSKHSSGLASLSIATSIISAVCQPFLAKLSDVFSRPLLCTISLVCYTVGYIIILKAPTLAAYVVGNVATSIGSTGLNLLATILCADLVPLKYRGLANGILSAPYIVIPWYTAYIVTALSDDKNWRWGYVMYAIIMPFVMGPAIILLFWLEHRAEKEGLAAAAKPNAHDDGKITAASPLLSRDRRVLLAWLELDGFGLILLGCGWSLLLLPFSLSSGAKGGYNNPSLIAMFAVGCICLILYPIYEYYFAKYPSAPIRLIKNKTFITAVIIDFIYLLAGYLQLLYLSSYVVAPYFNNTLTVGLCFGGVVAGLLQWWTRRYKLIQIIGLCIKIIGYGLLVDKNGVHDTGRLVASQALTGIGGSFSVVGSQVSSQASVPHTDVALAIALLSLWSGIGSSIGDAIASAHWGSAMPGNLRHFLPASVNDTQIATFFGDITTIKEYDYTSEIRQGAIKAYEKTVFLWAAALGLSFIALIAACFQTNYYLGNSQNAFDNKDTAGNDVEGGKSTRIQSSSGWQKVLRLWDM